MRRLALALLVVASVAFVWPLAHRAASLPDGPRTFRVATFNIHKGADRRAHYDLQKTIEAIARLDADVVGVQEAMQNHPDFNCDDQPALIAQALRKRTGRPWTQVSVKAWITDHRKCMELGRGKDIETENVAIVSRERIVSSNSIRLSEGRIGLEVRVASMPDVPVVVTHLSANQENQPMREREIATLVPWAMHQGPGILIGDFNARPEATELAAVTARYRDAWAEASAHGRTGGVTSGSTRPFGRVSRIDYVFYAPEGHLTLDSVDIVDTSTLGLGEVSDHHPVVATFRRTPPAHAADHE
jgi:endonuclease/exonuclease/phosphatase family metal-dependent hydrolase